jgi:hypothetical protein
MSRHAFVKRLPSFDYDFHFFRNHNTDFVIAETVSPVTFLGSFLGSIYIFRKKKLGQMVVKILIRKLEGGHR